MDHLIRRSIVDVVTRAHRGASPQCLSDRAARSLGITPPASASACDAGRRNRAVCRGVLGKPRHMVPKQLPLWFVLFVVADDAAVAVEAAVAVTYSYGKVGVGQIGPAIAGMVADSTRSIDA